MMRHALPLLLAACTGTATGNDDWQPVSYVDEGEVCFESSGVDLVAYVTAPDCLSSSCSRAFEGSCTLTMDDPSTLTLTSDIRWEQNVGERVACTDDCGIPRVSCTLPSLPDGTYTVAFGSQTLDLTFPATEPCDPF
jgi:hypothetical protein